MIPPGAEAVRAYLTARYEHQARDNTQGNVIAHRVNNAGKKVYLTARDLEALLTGSDLKVFSTSGLQDLPQDTILIDDVGRVWQKRYPAPEYPWARFGSPYGYSPDEIVLPARVIR
jgi:hypothetical protein